MRRSMVGNHDARNIIISHIILVVYRQFFAHDSQVKSESEGINAVVKSSVWHKVSQWFGVFVPALFRLSLF